MKRSLLCGILMATLLLSASLLLAADINFLTPITQDAFKKLSKEAGVALG
jgi:hypothetical protein